MAMSPRDGRQNDLFRPDNHPEAAMLDASAAKSGLSRN